MTTARKDGLKHVYWKPQEHAKLADAMLVIGAENPSLSVLKRLRMAQEQALPEDRRRPAIKTATTEKWIPAAMKAAQQRANARAKAEAAAAAAAAKGTSLAVPAAVTEAAAAPVVHVNGHASSAPALPAAPEPVVPQYQAASNLSNLRAMLVNELASIIQEAALKALGGSLVGGFAAQAPAKPSVLVAGLRGQQKEEVRKRYGPMLDLMFVGPDESKDLLRTQADKAHTAIVLIDHLTRSHVDIVKDRTKHLIELPGGMPMLLQALGRIAHPGAQAH